MIAWRPNRRGACSIDGIADPVIRAPIVYDETSLRGEIAERAIVPELRQEGQDMPEKHSRMVPGGRAVWYTERLWDLARDLPVRMVALADIPELDRDCWFGSAHVPTCRTVAQHAQRIWDADLSYPIILSADGGLMDGGHRLAKAWLKGLTEVRAVQFAVDPQPDYIKRAMVIRRESAVEYFAGN